MNTVPCRHCGSGVLATEPPERCNNCDPAVQAALAEVVDFTEADEIFHLPRHREA